MIIAAILNFPVVHKMGAGQKDDKIKRLQQENAKLNLPEGNILEEETFNRR